MQLTQTATAYCGDAAYACQAGMCAFPKRETGALRMQPTAARLACVLRVFPEEGAAPVFWASAWHAKAPPCLLSRREPSFVVLFSVLPPCTRCPCSSNSAQQPAARACTILLLPQALFCNTCPRPWVPRPLATQTDPSHLSINRSHAILLPALALDLSR